MAKAEAKVSKKKKAGAEAKVPKKKKTGKVRFCIVGMGIGRPNGRALMGDERGEIIALCDLQEARMKAFAKEIPNDVKFYTDYKKMCKDSEIDAVFVGTPNQWHVPVALEAVRNGKHVIVTKPLSDSEDAAIELVDEVEKAGLVNMMSLGTRYSAPCQHLGKLGREGYFGDFYYARARSVRRIGIPDWNLGFIEKGGGAFRDMGVHVLDAVWWIMGMPRPVAASAAAGAKFGPVGKGYWGGKVPPKKFYTRFTADDYAGGFVRFENDIGLIVESFWASHQPGEFQIELFGAEAGAKLNPLTLYRTDDNKEEDLPVKLPAQKQGFNLMAEEFIAGVLDGGEVRAPLRHGLVVQQMIEAILKSGETGQEIAIDAAM